MPFPGRGRGSEASQLGAASRLPFIRVAERLPRVHASAHPHPVLPHPGETGRGPEPRDPGRALCAQPSSRLFIALRPGRARLAHSCWKSGRGPVRTALGRSVPGPGGSPGTRGRGRGRERAASRGAQSVPGALFLAGLEGGFLPFPGREKEQGLHSSGRDGVFSGSFSAPVCRREPAAPRRQPPAAGRAAT